MTDVPDVNVWLALADENHTHHERARAYWQNESAPEIAFCRVTALAFFRLSTHPRVLSRPLTSDEAWDVFERYRHEGRVGFIGDPPEVDTWFMAFSRGSDFPHHLWTDCYLAALALSGDYRIISFDSDFNRFPQLRFLHLTPVSE